MSTLGKIKNLLQNTLRTGIQTFFNPFVAENTICWLTKSEIEECLEVVWEKLHIMHFAAKIHYFSPSLPLHSPKVSWGLGHSVSVCLPIAMFQWRLLFYSPGQRGIYLRRIINRRFSYIILGDEKNVSKAYYFGFFKMHSSMISYRSPDWEAKRCRLMLTGSFLDLICKVL